MLIKFQERPWDLYLILAYTSITSVVVAISGGGGLVALILVAFVPGYVVLAALFPRSDELDWVERLALSIGLSLAVVVLLGIAMNFATLGLRLVSVVAVISAFSLSLTSVAWWRRMRLSSEERLSMSANLAFVTWDGYNSLEKFLSIALVGSIVLAAGTLVYVYGTPRPVDHYTEFYILGSGGSTTGYPDRLNQSQVAVVLVQLVNHEQATVHYGLRVDQVGLQLTYNSTSGNNETLEANRTTLSWLNVTLDDEQHWTQPYTFAISVTGFWAVQFFLYQDSVPTNKELKLLVLVK